MRSETTEKVSIVFRALNEEKWFADALRACHEQNLDGLDLEIVLVDSGSTDRTLEIAQEFGCKIVHIKKSDFTFGRSLNYGCRAADGDYLAIISAHCIPATKDWLINLIRPLRDGTCDYSYGRQIGHDVTRFSEHQVFAQYFPPTDDINQDGCFINNANSALRKDTWEKYRFDEEVTGLEDMVLGRAIISDGGSISYIASAPVIHIHEETLSQVQRRYFREALVLRDIFPEIHFKFGDFLRYTTIGIMHDLGAARKQRTFFKSIGGIFGFRIMQYWGTYRGHNEHRVLSRKQKERYYYPKAELSASGMDQDVSDTSSLKRSFLKG